MRLFFCHGCHYAITVQGTSFSEAVATLEAEVKALKTENARLEIDSKGVYNQLRAKDKQLDSMMKEVEKAQEIQTQNLVHLML